MKDLFNTPEKIETAKSSFKDLLSHPGWQLFVEIIDGNIEFLKEQLENGTDEEETKASIDRIRDKLKVMRDVRNTPTTMIQKFESPDTDEPDSDPFMTVNDLKRSRNEAVEPE